MNTSNTLENAATPPLWRVLAAIFYDLWLIAALWLIGSTVDAMLSKALTGEAKSAFPWLLQIWLFLAPILYLGGFWTKGGQTTGMRAWRIKVLSSNGQPISRTQALLRYLGAAFSWLALGMGFIWMLFDRQGRAWHDHLSGTRLVMVEKRPREARINS